MAYSSLQSVREAAGMQINSGNETPVGVIDGVNKLFTAKHRPFVGRNYSDPATRTGGDVSAYVNGTAVSIASIDANAGTVTLSAAPAAGTRVTLIYAFSPKSAEYIQGKLAEAENWIDTKIQPYISLPLDPIPGIISTIANVYAAGLILSTEQGNSGDSDSTSRDGALKLKTARELMADYIQGLIDSRATGNDNGSEQAASAVTDGEVFTRERNLAGRTYNTGSDELFHDRAY